MLKKLLKYDLKNIYKSQIIFYIIALVSAVLMNICYLKIEIKIFEIIYWILGFINISLIFAIIINNITRLWLRFINNLYKDESYLTYTLPVTKTEIYLSKLLTTIITLFTSFLVILIMLLIIVYPLDLLPKLETIFESIGITSKNMIVTGIILIITYGIEMIHLIQIGYTGIILGHKKNNNKILNSLIYGIFCYIIISLLSLLVVYIIGLINIDVLELFKTNQMPTKEVIKLLITIIIIFYIFIVITFSIINIKLKHLSYYQ